MLVKSDRPLVGHRIAAIVEPVFDQLNDVANAAAVNANPVDAFNPVALKAIFLESRATEVEVFASVLFVHKLGHDCSSLIIQREEVEECNT